MKKSILVLAMVSVSLIFAVNVARAQTRTWADAGTDWNTDTNWTLANVPDTSAEIAMFNNLSPLVNQPNISSSVTVNYVIMQNATVGGITLSSSPGATLTVMSTSAAAAGAALASHANGTGATPNEVSANVVLGAAEGATQTFIVRNNTDMRLFTVSGNISSTNTVNLNLALGTNSGNGIALTGCNSFTGNLFISGAKIAYLNTIGNVGASSAAGAGSTIRLGGDAGGSGTTGNLYYTGSATSTNKTLEFSGTTGNRTIRHTGTGLLQFAGPVTGAANTGTSTRILNFGAVSAGAGIEIKGDLVDWGTIPWGTTGNNSTQVRIIFNNAGIVTFAGNNTYTGTTEIGHATLGAGGTLLVNGNHTNAGTYSMTVNSSSAPFLGGNGVITYATAGTLSVVSGGGLTPGGNADGTWSAGTLTLNLGTGGSGNLNLASMTGNNAGRLVFDLAAPGASDKVLLGANTELRIGAGLLEKSDFTFNLRSGFTAGTYTLFDTSLTVNGTLSGAAGALDIDFGGGYSGTIGLSGDGTDIILTVIPEPATVGMAVAGLALMVLRRRIRG